VSLHRQAARHGFIEQQKDMTFLDCAMRQRCISNMRFYLLGQVAGEALRGRKTA
jgi:hypothetical protein